MKESEREKNQIKERVNKQTKSRECCNDYNTCNLFFNCFFNSYHCLSRSFSPLLLLFFTCLHSQLPITLSLKWCKEKKNYFFFDYFYLFITISSSSSSLPSLLFPNRFVFVEFVNAQQAYQALKKINGFQLDKQHVFEAVSLAEFERFEKVSDVYQPPNPEEYSERENLKSWLLNERCIDQYVVLHDMHTQILANTKNEPEQVYHRQQWTETYVSWSPLGTYLATFHKPGIALWGGPQWSKIVRFQHQGVKLISWSPQEKYLVTWSNEVPEDPNDPQSIIVWDVRSGQKLRGFAGGPVALWPIFKWSHDDKYVARLGEDTISIYAAPGMGLLDKKSIKVAGVKDFAWSPTSNLLAYWVAENGNNPARVVIMSIPTREEKSVKNLFNVTDCKLHWQPSGDYLAVKVDRHTKTKKSTFVNFEIFRIREKGIPVDVLEAKGKSV